MMSLADNNFVFLEARAKNVISIHFNQIVTVVIQHTSNRVFFEDIERK